MSAMHMAKAEEGAATRYAVNSFEIREILFSKKPRGNKAAQHPKWPSTWDKIPSSPLTLTWNTKLQKFVKLFKLLSETVWPWPYLPYPV